MALPTPAEQASALSVLESQLRECFGRAVYSHKTHEKCADAALHRLRHIKILQIALSAITTGGLITVLFGEEATSRVAALISAVMSTALLALNTYTKDNDLGQITEKHKDAADRLWSIRESYLSLLADLRAGVVSIDAIRSKRDELQEALGSIYSSAPRTNAAGYAKAAKALKIQEDLTFTDREIDQFLPAQLRRQAS